MARVSVCVSRRTLPANMIVAPNSPMPRANASTQPAISPPAARGSDTRRKVGAGPTPRVREAAVDRFEGGERLAHVEGRGDEGDRKHDRPLGEGDDDPGFLERRAEQD